MNNTKKQEMYLIRSRALILLFSLVLSALILLPLFTSAKEKNKESKNIKVYMQPLNKDSHAAVTISSPEEGKYTLSIESDNGSDVNRFFYKMTLSGMENYFGREEKHAN